MSDDSDGQRQCRRGVTGDVELDAAMALADMAGAESQPRPRAPPHHRPAAAAAPHQAAAEDEEELASTRLSLELGKVGIQSASPCSSSSSAGHPHPAHHHQHHQPHAVPAPAAAATGYGTLPRHMLTEAEKEAKRLRRVLANRESARQTILRRQAIRDELARKVADLSSQNENMKKEKDMVIQEYLSLKEANKQLKEQARHHHRPSLSLSLSPLPL
ncbi:actin cytoskeleton-regulatory complex protein pan1-like [Panicum miliaceum]|uniref:Actin cytoskeleton-regulatory complex protein pan1-like n=1 Tax=Panicum miliaceum TaxID=4540 RepID=A0A3L6PJ49_PANMI|nr:actin cytoskeleton-regulatory complex protein pan1-like [Panicum miliaceum]